jgi:hypothetical protein
MRGRRKSHKQCSHELTLVSGLQAYDSLVKTPEDRKRLERSAPLLVTARDAAVVELKREKLTAELAHRNSQNHTLRL